MSRCRSTLTESAVSPDFEAVTPTSCEHVAGVAVAGTGVAVGGTGVGVAGIGVLVGGRGVAVAGTAVAATVAGNGVGVGFLREASVFSGNSHMPCKLSGHQSVGHM